MSGARLWGVDYRRAHGTGEVDCSNVVKVVVAWCEEQALCKEHEASWATRIVGHGERVPERVASTSHGNDFARGRVNNVSDTKARLRGRYVPKASI